MLETVGIYTSEASGWRLGFVTLESQFEVGDSAIRESVLFLSCGSNIESGNEESIDAGFLSKISFECGNFSDVHTAVPFSMVVGSLFCCCLLEQSCCAFPSETKLIPLGACAGALTSVTSCLVGCLVMVLKEGSFLGVVLLELSRFC